MGAYDDLVKFSSESFEDNNYFIVTIEELQPGRIYPIQFRWKYKNGSYGKDWSATYNLITESEQVPGAPGVTANGDTPGMITITWDGENVQGANIENVIKQVDIYISGAPFDGTKPAINFDKAGTKTVTAPAGVYTIVAYAITARGTVSTQTTIANVTVTGLEPPVDPPTLPSGLSVAPGPFVVSVNWPGTYASSDFDGFKSIDIHVRGSDVGSTATSGFSTTTQVATLTVTGTANRQNIGLDNLRQALSLANNQAAYTSPMFFYYIARNTNDELYSVGGVPTYTRINSTSVNPTQANFIDLASGVISIENLVAGNGQFSSWLRAGSAGGTRIELSAVNDFTNGGNTVQKGLVAYSSGSTEIFNLDIDAGTLTINGSGTFTGNLTAGSGSSIFKSDSSGIYLGNEVFASAPFSVSRSGVIKAESGTIGGLTLASNAISNSSNTFKIGSTGQLLLGSESAGQNNLLLTPTQIVHRTGSTSTGIFTLDIATGTLSLSGYASTAALNGKSKTYYQNDQPSSGMIQGDIWIDANDSYKVYTYTGTAWQLSQDSASAQTTANTAANRAQKFDLVGNVNLGIALNNTGSIYSNKSTYGSGTTGWFLGYRDLGGGTLTPALDIGGTSSYLRWTGSGIEVKGSIDGSTISGSTVTGGLIRTASSGASISISGSDQGTNPNAITFTNTSGSPIAHIVPLNIGGSTFGLLMHYGSTADQSGGTYPQLYVGPSNVSISARQFSGGPTGLVAVADTGVTLQVQNGASIGISGGNVSFGTTTGQVMEYINSSGNLRIGSNITRLQADGQIFANTLGVASGTTLVQSSGGFIKVSSSSRRYKENIVEIDKSGYLNTITQLKPVTFNYKQEVSPDDYDVLVSGLIAEDVDEIENLRTVVNYNIEGLPESVSYDRLSALIVLAIKEIKDKLESIEQRLDALEG